MADISVKYLGLDLKNPIVVGASSLTSDLGTMKKLEDAGAAAIVFKSLFEEQIHLESAQMDEDLYGVSDLHAEHTSLFPKLQHAGPEAHLINIRKAKESLGIPVIASLNCTEDETWVEYARLLEKTGVDALELNFFSIPKNFDVDGKSIEENQIELIRVIKSKVSIPISVKLSQFYTNPLNIISRLDKSGVNGLVLFNRLFEPEINPDEIKHIAPFNLSHEGDHRLAVRYAGLLFNQVKASICAATGIYTGHDVVKLILAGADCVQVVSTLYKHKPEYITSMISDIENWMNAKKFGSINDFRGLLSKAKVKDPFIYKRAQYIDLILGSEKMFR